MRPEDLKRRTKRFALRVIRLVRALPRNPVGDITSRQLFRAGTSVGANYRSACRAQSAADFVAKMHRVQEEADESLYWMELLAEARIVPLSRLKDLMQETEELVAIIVASIKTARRKTKAARPPKGQA